MDDTDERPVVHVEVSGHVEGSVVMVGRDVAGDVSVAGRDIAAEEAEAERAQKAREITPTPGELRPAPPAAIEDAAPQAVPYRRGISPLVWVGGGAALVVGVLALAGVFGGGATPAEEEAPPVEEDVEESAPVEEETAVEEPAGDEASAEPPTEDATASASSTIQAIEAAAAARDDNWPGWPLAFYDLFESNENGWATGASSDEYWTLSRVVGDGKYRWEGTALNDDVLFLQDIRFGSMSDFYLTVEANRISGPDTSAYGVVFRSSGEWNAYLLQVREGLQAYQVGEWLDGEWNTVIDWSEATAIRPDGPNRIAVIGEGSRLTILINEQYVDAFDDERRSGAVGLAIGLHHAGDEIVVEFDNLELYSP